MTIASHPRRWFVWLTLFLFTLHLHAATDMFMEYSNNIKGETQDAEYKSKSASDVLAWSWGISSSTTILGAGRTTFQDLSFTKRIDTATTGLMNSLAKGARLDSCKLTCLKAGDRRSKYMEITLLNCNVTSLSTGGSSGDGSFLENVTITFSKVKVEYFKEDSRGQSVSAGIFEWDVAANTNG